MLVDISRWREGREIRASDHGVQIGALATLSDIASNPLIATEYAALAEACKLSAAPQLRNMGTIGGNLLQAKLAVGTFAGRTIAGSRVETTATHATAKMSFTQSFILHQRRACVLAPLHPTLPPPYLR